jgi:hypothetical protein
VLALLVQRPLGQEPAQALAAHKQHRQRARGETRVRGQVLALETARSARHVRETKDQRAPPFCADKNFRYFFFQQKKFRVFFLGKKFRVFFLSGEFDLQSKKKRTFSDRAK